MSPCPIRRSPRSRRNTGAAVGSSTAMIPAPSSRADRPGCAARRARRAATCARASTTRRRAGRAAPPARARSRCTVCELGLLTRVQQRLARPEGQREPAERGHCEDAEREAAASARPCRPIARKSAGPSVDGFNESAAAIDGDESDEREHADELDHTPALAFAAVPPRVLILTASVGEGHDLAARTLAAQLREEHPDIESRPRTASSRWVERRRGQRGCAARRLLPARVALGHRLLAVPGTGSHARAHAASDHAASARRDCCA